MRAIDIIIEVVFEVLGAAIRWVTDNPKVPRPVRAAITILFVGPLLVLCIAAAVLLADSIALRTFFWVVALVMAFALYKLLARIFK